MEIIEQTKGAVRVLAPKGPLSTQDADDFRSRAATAVGETMGRVLIDASGIPFADSHGLEVLLEISEMLGQSGQSLKLCGATDTLREVLDLTEIAPQCDFYAEVNEAVRSFL